MKFNQYSYLPVDQADILKELKEDRKRKNCLNGLFARFISPTKIQIILSLT